MSSDNNQENKQSSKKGLARREFLKVGGAGLAVAASPALGAAAKSTRSARRYAQGNPTVVRWLTWYIEQQDEYPKIIADFEAKNPNIKIDLQLKSDVTGGYVGGVVGAAACGNGDDMYEIYGPHVHSVEFGRKGIALDLLAALGSDFMSDFFPSANSMFLDAGHLYAVGWMAQTLGIFYDPDMFKQAGIDGEPETWDEMITASNMIKTKLSGNLGVMQIGSDGFSVSDLWMPMITGFSGDTATLKQLDDHVLPWTNKAVVDALALYKKTLEGNLWQKGLTGMQSADCENAMFAGKAAAFYSGSWEPTTFYKSAPPDLMKRLKVMKTPAVAAGGRHWTGNSAGAAFSVANGKNKDAALTFFKFMYSPEIYARTMINSTSMPATKSASAHATDPLLKLMTSSLADGCRHWLTGPAGQAIADAIEQFTQTPTDPTTTAQAMEDGELKVQPLGPPAATASS